MFPSVRLGSVLGRGDAPETRSEVPSLVWGAETRRSPLDIYSFLNEKVQEWVRGRLRVITVPTPDSCSSLDLLRPPSRRWCHQGLVSAHLPHAMSYLASTRRFPGNSFGPRRRSITDRVLSVSGKRSTIPLFPSKVDVVVIRPYLLLIEGWTSPSTVVTLQEVTWT